MAQGNSGLYFPQTTVNEIVKVEIDSSIEMKEPEPPERPPPSTEYAATIHRPGWMNQAMGLASKTVKTIHPNDLTKREFRYANVKREPEDQGYPNLVPKVEPIEEAAQVVLEEAPPPDPMYIVNSGQMFSYPSTSGMAQFDQNQMADKHYPQPTSVMPSGIGAQLAQWGKPYQMRAAQAQAPAPALAPPTLPQPATAAGFQHGFNQYLARMMQLQHQNNLLAQQQQQLYIQQVPQFTPIIPSSQQSFPIPPTFPVVQGSNPFTVVQRQPIPSFDIRLNEHSAHAYSVQHSPNKENASITVAVSDTNLMQKQEQADIEERRKKEEEKRKELEKMKMEEEKKRMEEEKKRKEEEEKERQRLLSEEEERERIEEEKKKKMEEEKRLKREMEEKKRIEEEARKRKKEGEEKKLKEEEERKRKEEEEAKKRKEEEERKIKEEEEAKKRKEEEERRRKEEEQERKRKEEEERKRKEEDEQRKIREEEEAKEAEKRRLEEEEKEKERREKEKKEEEERQKQRRKEEELSIEKKKMKERIQIEKMKEKEKVERRRQEEERKERERKEEEARKAKEREEKKRKEEEEAEAERQRKIKEAEMGAVSTSSIVNETLKSWGDKRVTQALPVDALPEGNPVKRKRGRPRKVVVAETTPASVTMEKEKEEKDEDDFVKKYQKRNKSTDGRKKNEKDKKSMKKRKRALIESSSEEEEEDDDNDDTDTTMGRSSSSRTLSPPAPIFKSHSCSSRGQRSRPSHHLPSIDTPHSAMSSPLASPGHGSMSPASSTATPTSEETRTSHPRIRESSAFMTDLTPQPIVPKRPLTSKGGPPSKKPTPPNSKNEMMSSMRSTSSDVPPSKSIPFRIPKKTLSADSEAPPLRSSTLAPKAPQIPSTTVTCKASSIPSTTVTPKAPPTVTSAPIPSRTGSLPAKKVIDLRRASAPIPDDFVSPLDNLLPPIGAPSSLSTTSTTTPSIKNSPSTSISSTVSSLPIPPIPRRFKPLDYDRPSSHHSPSNSSNDSRSPSYHGPSNSSRVIPRPTHRSPSQNHSTSYRSPAYNASPLSNIDSPHQDNQYSRSPLYNAPPPRSRSMNRSPHHSSSGRSPAYDDGSYSAIHQQIHSRSINNDNGRSPAYYHSPTVYPDAPPPYHDPAPPLPPRNYSQSPSVYPYQVPLNNGWPGAVNYEAPYTTSHYPSNSGPPRCLPPPNQMMVYRDEAPPPEYNPAVPPPQHIHRDPPRIPHSYMGLPLPGTSQGPPPRLPPSPSELIHDEPHSADVESQLSQESVVELSFRRPILEWTLIPVDGLHVHPRADVEKRQLEMCSRNFENHLKCDVCDGITRNHPDLRRVPMDIPIENRRPPSDDAQEARVKREEEKMMRRKIEEKKREREQIELARKRKELNRLQKEMDVKKEMINEEVVDDQSIIDQGDERMKKENKEKRRLERQKMLEALNEAKKKIERQIRELSQEHPMDEEHEISADRANAHALSNMGGDLNSNNDNCSTDDDSIIVLDDEEPDANDGQLHNRGSEDIRREIVRPPGHDIIAGIFDAIKARKRNEQSMVGNGVKDGDEHHREDEEDEGKRRRGHDEDDRMNGASSSSHHNEERQSSEWVRPPSSMRISRGSSPINKGTKHLSPREDDPERPSRILSPEREPQSRGQWSHSRVVYRNLNIGAAAFKANPHRRKSGDSVDSVAPKSHICTDDEDFTEDRSIFIQNIDRNLEKEVLMTYFARYGKIRAFSQFTTQYGSNYAKIAFVDQKNMMDCLQDEHSVNGCTLRVSRYKRGGTRPHPH